MTNNYPITKYKETPYDVTQHPKVENKKHGLIFSVFNRLDVTKFTLPILISEVKNNTEIIVVNDGSTDGTKEWLKTIPDITVINCQKNVGIAESQNKALQLCKHRNYEYTIFHDNDVIMNKDWVGELRKVLEQDKRIGIVGASLPVLYQKFSAELTKGEIVRHIAQVAISAPHTKKPHFSPTVNMVKREVFEQVGHFDEVFTGFGSQCVDFIMRVYLAGWKAYTLNWVIGNHFIHSTVGIGFGKKWWSAEKMTTHNVNAFVKKWGMRFNNSKPFLRWVRQQLKEDWFNA